MQTRASTSVPPSNGSVSAVHPTETKEACHAIQSPGSPDYPGAGAGRGLALTVAACSSSSSTSASTSSRLERSGRLVARRHRQFRRGEQPGHRVKLSRGGGDHRELGEVLQLQHPHRGEGRPAAKREHVRPRPSRPSPACPWRAGSEPRSPRDGELSHLGHRDLQHHGTSGTSLLSNQKRHGGLPGRGLEGRRRQPLRPVQADTRRHGAIRVQFGRLRQGRSVGQPGGGSLR